LRFLSDAERDCLLAACLEISGVRLHGLVILALATGARRGELLALRWSDIDLRARIVTLGRSARSGGRPLPLPAAAVETLRPLAKVRRIGGDEIFADASGRVGFPRRQWEAALREAGLEDFRFHDLRHSAAAYLAEGGKPQG
ncbi:MAG: site-specific integrase, partial [Acidobacteriota bacterium]